MHRIKRLWRQLNLDDFHPAAALFLGACLLLALYGLVDWRRDRRLSADGVEIRAQVTDRRTRIEEDCDNDDIIGTCTTETIYYLTYRFPAGDQFYEAEKTVDDDLYARTEETIPILFLPHNPRVSDVADNVANVRPFPLFSVFALIVGLTGAALIWRFA